MTQNELLQCTKKALYNNYKEPNNYVDIADEISHSIPNCSISGITKCHDGIHLSFNYESSKTNTSDIENAASSILSDALFNTNEVSSSRELANYINGLHNMNNVLFNLLTITDNFTIII